MNRDEDIAKGIHLFMVAGVFLLLLVTGIVGSLTV